MLPEEDWHSIYSEDPRKKTEEDKERSTLQRGYNFRVWIQGFHCGQVLHQEPQFVFYANTSRYIHGAFLSRNTNLIVSDGLFTPSKSDIKCKIRLYLQIPGINRLIF